MPSPIHPINELTAHNDIFENRSYEGLSELQKLFISDIENVPTRSASKRKVAPQCVAMLKQIFNNKNEDEVLTTAANLYKNLPKAHRIYTVPTTISDSDLLSLKTAGLVQGHYRSVTITEDGYIALRDAALNENNKISDNRIADVFDVRSASDNKFVKTASKKSSQFVRKSDFK